MRWIAKYLELVDAFTSMEEEGSTEEHTACPKGKIPFKKLERIVGVLVYVSQMYTCMVPYLKGIYLTLDSRPHGCGEPGWTIPKQHWDDAEVLDGMPPRFVKRVACLQCDVEVLMSLTCRSDPT